MITKVEALRYRCLRYVNQRLLKVNAFVGPNASGKSTFLDVIAFLGDLVREGPAAAVASRTDNVMDLFWQRSGPAFELAIEAAIPGALRKIGDEEAFDTVRYEVRFGFLDDSGSTTSEFGILGERLYFKVDADPGPQKRLLFPELVADGSVYYAQTRLPRAMRGVIHKKHGHHDNYYSEQTENRAGGWLPSFRFGPQKSALGNLPDDGTRFPVSTWLREFLSQDIQQIVLDSRAVRKYSPPGQDKKFLRDGSNLPWVIDNLRRENPQVYQDWMSQVQVALPEIDAIDIQEREDTKHKFLVVKYKNGITVPSWVVSDGTLRFLALTLLAYLQDSSGTYLIEEPENGIHPTAIGYLLEAFSAIEHGQLLLATHSPVAVGKLDRESLLCFSKCDGATDIVSGRDHPALADWDDTGNLGIIFQSGILG